MALAVRTPSAQGKPWAVWPLLAPIHASDGRVAYVDSGRVSGQLAADCA